MPNMRFITSRGVPKSRVEIRRWSASIPVEGGVDRDEGCGK